MADEWQAAARHPESRAVLYQLQHVHKMVLRLETQRGKDWGNI